MPGTVPVASVALAYPRGLGSVTTRYGPIT
jgi:hypothetical protein